MSAPAVGIGARSGASWRDLLIRAFGWIGLLWQHDPATVDRWRWLGPRLGNGGRALDLGSGSGVFTMAAARRGYQAIGVSFDALQNARADRRARALGLDGVAFTTADLRDLPWMAPALGRFDLVICLETIEHLGDDAGFLATVADLLEPGGRLLLTTPTDDHRPLVGERLSEVEDGGHVRWGYSERGLAALLQDAGLEPIRFDRLSGVVSQAITNLARRAARFAGERGAWAITAPLRILLPLDRPLTRLVGGRWLAIAVEAVKR